MRSVYAEARTRSSDFAVFAESATTAIQFRMGYRRPRLSDDFLAGWVFQETLRRNEVEEGRHGYTHAGRQTEIAELAADPKESLKSSPRSTLCVAFRASSPSKSPWRCTRTTLSRLTCATSSGTTSRRRRDHGRAPARRRPASPLSRLPPSSACGPPARPRLMLIVAVTIVGLAVCGGVRSPRRWHDLLRPTMRVILGGTAAMIVTA